MPFLLHGRTSDVGSAAVVAGENDQGPLCRSALLQGIEHLAYDGIGFHNEIGIHAETALALPLFVQGQAECVAR